MSIIRWKKRYNNGVRSNQKQFIQMESWTCGPLVLMHLKQGQDAVK